MIYVRNPIECVNSVLGQVYQLLTAEIAKNAKFLKLFVKANFSALSAQFAVRLNFALKLKDPPLFLFSYSTLTSPLKQVIIFMSIAQMSDSHKSLK